MARRQERQPPGQMPSVVMLAAAAAAAAIAIALEKEAGEEEHAGRHTWGEF